jgi:hypothetical protein
MNFKAAFDSELQVSSRGAARGYMLFGFGEKNLDYVAERGGLDFDEAGNPVRAWFLMLLRGSQGRLALDYLLGSVRPIATDEHLICEIAGTQVNYEPVQFIVTGRFGIRSA